MDKSETNHNTNNPPIDDIKPLPSSYKILDVQGEGNFGQVMIGLHNETQQKVAIKILDKGRIKDESDITRIQREIDIFMKLSHPNIVALYEVIEKENQLFFVMEYAENGDLSNILKSKRNYRLTAKEAGKYFWDLILGIEYLHSCKCVHRDLKPENLLLDKNLRLKITDFGLSNNYRGRNRLKTPCGSPSYAAPEMIAGNKYEPLKIDIWSCGIILYVMLSGTFPFSDKSVSGLYKKILKNDYTCPSFFNEDENDIINRLIDSNPVTRIGLEELKSHKWMQENKPRNLEIETIERQKVFQNKIILELLHTKYGITDDLIRQTFMYQKYNSLRAYYCLEQQRFENLSIEQLLVEVKELEIKSKKDLLVFFNNKQNQKDIVDSKILLELANEESETERLESKSNEVTIKNSSESQNQVKTSTSFIEMDFIQSSKINVNEVQKETTKSNDYQYKNEKEKTIEKNFESKSPKNPEETMNPEKQNFYKYKIAEQKESTQSTKQENEPARIYNQNPHNQYRYHANTQEEIPKGKSSKQLAFNHVSKECTSQEDNKSSKIIKNHNKSNKKLSLSQNHNKNATIINQGHYKISRNSCNSNKERHYQTFNDAKNYLKNNEPESQKRGNYYNSLNFSFKKDLSVNSFKGIKMYDIKKKLRNGNSGKSSAARKMEAICKQDFNFDKYVENKSMLNKERESTRDKLLGYSPRETNPFDEKNHMIFKFKRNDSISSNKLKDMPTSIPRMSLCNNDSFNNAVRFSNERKKNFMKNLRPNNFMENSYEQKKSTSRKKLYTDLGNSRNIGAKLNMSPNLYVDLAKNHQSLSTNKNISGGIQYSNQNNLYGNETDKSLNKPGKSNSITRVFNNQEKPRKIDFKKLTKNINNHIQKRSNANELNTAKTLNNSKNKIASKSDRKLAYENAFQFDYQKNNKMKRESSILSGKNNMKNSYAQHNEYFFVDSRNKNYSKLSKQLVQRNRISKFDSLNSQEKVNQYERNTSQTSNRYSTKSNLSNLKIDPAVLIKTKTNMNKSIFLNQKTPRKVLTDCISLNQYKIKKAFKENDGTLNSEASNCSKVNFKIKQKNNKNSIDTSLNKSPNFMNINRNNSASYNAKESKNKLYDKIKSRKKTIKLDFHKYEDNETDEFIRNSQKNKGIFKNHNCFTQREKNQENPTNLSKQETLTKIITRRATVGDTNQIIKQNKVNNQVNKDTAVFNRQGNTPQKPIKRNYFNNTGIIAEDSVQRHNEHIENIQQSPKQARNSKNFSKLCK